MKNALTIDVEDYFMVSAFEPMVPKSDWTKYPLRALGSTRLILDILKESDVKATFFVLGWIAERHPELVRSIHDEGHEVASHGYHHQLLYDLTPEQFRKDIRESKRVLEGACGARVIGYRAPSFSIVKDTQWALDILREEGFKYDSSIMPAPHARGGMEGANPAPHERQGLVELPMSTLKFAGKDLPFSGGGYFRFFPYWLVRHGLKQCNGRGLPGVTYFHPWEFDPAQPRLKGRRADEFKHYVNLDKTESKFRRMLKDFPFAPAREVLAEKFALT